ncbi:MAG: hypothetical protein QXK24_07625, partial [Ignisphaera sp.]
MCLRRKLLCVILVGLIIQSLMSFIDIAQVFGYSSLSIKLKWRANAGTGGTWLGPLAADLNNDGFMEIVITGHYGVAALNPLNGSVLWSAPYGGGHCPFEIIDLNNDGIPEILLSIEKINGSSASGVIALHGNNGSIYWYNKNAAGKGTYIAVADINADGHPEIYSAQAGRITALTYDGRIFASTYTYYPCWGGLTIGDTDFDGVFEVYLGERSDSYPYVGSPGRGLRAFWANNLTERWAHTDILCSSQAPVLADVDKDGDLEIIILHQRRGIAVINTDGSVNTYNNKYRKQLNIPSLPSNGHTNPTVADVDDDGNLELIQCGDASHNWYNPAIWDLVEWKLDAILPFKSMDPPGVADIDGDGKLEIIAPNEKNVTIFKYNKITAKYEIIYTIPLSMAHPFFIAQDIDADGKLELVFNQYNSWVSVYGVEKPAPKPLPRSGLYFYSQYRTRVPVYVSPPEQPPKISEISPREGETNIPVTLSELSFKLIDYQNNLMNYTVTTNPNIGSASGTNVSSGTIITVPVSGLTSLTTYTWTVRVTDGNYTTTRTFTFYTEGAVTLTIKISPTGSGSVIKNPDNTSNIYVYGTRIKLTAVADNIVYRFSRWDGDLKWMGSNNPAIIIMDGDKTVTAIFTKIEYTLTINISPTGCGSVNVNKTKPYYYGDIIELTANPNVGWSFSHWMGDLTGSQNPTTIVINGNKKVTAVFTQCQYNLTITIVGKGNVTIEPYKTAYTYGENVTLTAIANSGWMFISWSGDASGSENSITIIMNSNKSVVANFIPEEGYTLIVNVTGNGIVNKNPNYTTYIYGENVTLTAIPDPGWKFVGWSGDITGNKNPCSVVMNSNKTVYAIFIQEQYVLTVNIEGLGNVTKIPDQLTYIYGTQVQLSASADAGWIFIRWSGDIESVNNPVSFEITGNMTITAHFALKHFTINASVEGVGGTIEPSGVIMIAYGENITFTIEPNVGYHILKVLVDGEDIGPISQYTFYSVNMNHSITAFFAPNKYTLAVNVSPEGSGSVTLNNTGPYCYGDAVLLIAEPNDGWIFSHWSGDASGTNNSITIIIDGNKSLTAVFVETQAWWNTAWKYRRVITINHTKVSGDLIDFPLL